VVRLVAGGSAVVIGLQAEFLEEVLIGWLVAAKVVIPAVLYRGLGGVAGAGKGTMEQGAKEKRKGVFSQVRLKSE